LFFCFLRLNKYIFKT